MPKKEKKTSQSKDTVSVNLLPISILLAAIIISATIIFSQGDGNNEVAQDQPGSNDETVLGEEEGDFKQVEVSIDDDPYIGDRGDATVAIVEFSEFQCSYCKRHNDETLPLIKDAFVDTGKIIYVFRDFQMYGELSENLSKIGECVNDISGIEEFAGYHSEAYNFSTVEDAYSYLDDNGVNTDKVRSCVEDSSNDELTADMNAGQTIGIQGTPGFVVGKLDEDGNVKGVLVPGAYPFTQFETLIESYL